MKSGSVVIGERHSLLTVVGTVEMSAAGHDPRFHRGRAAVMGLPRSEARGRLIKPLSGLQRA